MDTFSLTLVGFLVERSVSAQTGRRAENLLLREEARGMGVLRESVYGSFDIYYAKSYVLCIDFV